MINRKKFLLNLVFLFFLFISTSSASETKKKILILYSLQPRMPAFEILDQNFRNLQLNQDTQVEYFTEYLEHARFRDKKSVKKQADLINHKYKINKPDIVIAVMSPALNFIQKYCKTTFNNTPIVYALLDKKVDPKHMAIKATGVNLHIDLQKTLKAALSVQPETRDVYVVVGTSALGRSWEAQAKEKFLQLSGQINFHYLSGLSMVEVLHKVSKLPPQAIVLYLLIIKDASGKSFVPREALNKISRSSSVPVYGLWSTYVGHGIIGGYLCSSDLLGKNINKMIIRILNGESLDKVHPISVGPSIHMFDWRQMKRFGISEKRIPEENIILFKTQTVWDKYKIYIVGFFLFALAESILILALTMNIKNRKIAEINLADSNDRYKTLFQDSPVPLWEEDFSEIYEYFSKLRENGITDFKSYFHENPSELSNCAQKIKIIDVNQATLVLHKAKNKKELLGNLDKVFTEESLKIFKEEIITLSEGKFEFESEGEVKTLSGEPRYIFIKMLIDQKQKKLGRALISTTDLTERKKIEENLRKAQKMESIGTLAGGIAHDFNNILYPIIGFTEMSMQDLPKTHEVQENLQDILDGAKRARDLIKQILLFARQEKQTLKPIILKPVVEEALKLLRSSISANIDIQSHFYDGKDYVLSDATEIHEIVMNLCINAYHSMEEDGGTLIVRLNKQKPSSDLNLPSGEYICLSVSDSGVGIPKEIIDKIFEPYLTTKELGKGSGLGLSVVHGIVTNYKGNISVESSPGKGSVFNIFLPVTIQSEKVEQKRIKDKPLDGTENILFVDDEASIVKLAIRILERLGYTITGKTSCTEAFELFKEKPDTFDLVITDMAMPIMTGTELAKKILKIQPDMPIIICTGFSEKVDPETAKSIGIKEYIKKPILTEELTSKIRKVLDQSSKK